MNKHFFWTIAFLCLHTLLQSQTTTQWASELLKVSSELSPPNNPQQYSGKQVLGPPSVLSKFGATPCAWSPSKQSRETNEFIEVGFAEPMQVCQIAIAEGMNPNAIFEIYLFDTEGKKYKVFQQIPKPVLPKDKEGRLFLHKIPLTSYKVKALRLELITLNVPGFNQIDAIGISNDTLPIEIKIETVEGADLVGVPENLGAGVNSKALEFAPIISPDGRTIYFVRQKHHQNIGNPDAQDIWYAEKDSLGVFGEAINLGGPINNANNNAICAVTPDGQSLLILNKYLTDGRTEKGVSMTFKTEKGWSFPQGLEIEDFYNDNRYGEYNLAADGKTLVMAVQRKEGSGDKDIHVSFRQDDGKWSVPKNIGPMVNTGDSELSPYLAADGKTLFFATTGYPGYGAQDMFMTRRLDDSWTNWTHPLNLGPKLNTAGFDAYYSITASGDYAYFSSSEKSIGQSDIFKVELPKSARPQPVVLIYGQVMNAKTNEPLGAAISYESLTSAKQVGRARSNPTTGAYRIVLPSGDAYGFLAQQKGFISVSENIDLKNIKDYKEIRVDLKLAPIEVGAAIRLNNLFFDSNKFTLKTEDRSELNRVVEILKNYPTMQIEIAGYTDNVGADASNVTLSNNRAKAVLDYLVEQGIDKTRLQSKGYGKASPVGNNATPEGRAQNRRIEMKILKVE